LHKLFLARLSRTTVVSHIEGRKEFIETIRLIAELGKKGR
jgi:hypothetical protein